LSTLHERRFTGDASCSCHTPYAPPPSHQLQCDRQKRRRRRRSIANGNTSRTSTRAFVIPGSTPVPKPAGTIDRRANRRRGQSGLSLVLAEQRRGWSLMIFCARATRGLRRMGREQPGALLARRTRTVKLCSFDARSKGQPWPLP
jgi:hypothetical protein